MRRPAAGLSISRPGRYNFSVPATGHHAFHGEERWEIPRRGGRVPFAVRMGANAIAILLIAYLLPMVLHTEGALAALGAAFVLGLVNAVIRPIFILLTLPVTVFTLGIFLLVINGLLLWLVSGIVPGFHVNGFFGAVAGSVLISLISWILTQAVP
jgi:putative membrane protein